MILQYVTIRNNNIYVVELGFDLFGVVDQSKIHLMVVELLQFKVGVHGCSNTNRNENCHLLSSRGVGSFVEGTVKNQVEIGSQNELK